MEELKKSNEILLALESEKRLFIDFWATWCRPCTTVKPFVSQIKEERKDVLVLDIDIEEFPDLVRELGIISVPTFRYYENGKMISEKVGAIPKKVMNDMIDKII